MNMNDAFVGSLIFNKNSGGGGGGTIPTFSSTTLVDNSSSATSFTFSDDYHNYDFVRFKIHNSSSNKDTYIVTTASAIDAIFDISTYINFNEYNSNQYVCYEQSNLTWTKHDSRNCNIIEVSGLNCTNATVTETEIYKATAMNVSTSVTTQLDLFDFDWILFSANSDDASEIQPCNNITQFVKGLSDIGIDGQYVPFNRYYERTNVYMDNHYISAERYAYIVGIKFT